MSDFLREEGATTVEYALLVALIAIACVLVVGQFGADLDAMYAAIRDAIPDRDATSTTGF